MEKPKNEDIAALSELNARFIKNFVTQDTVSHNQIIHKDFVCIENSGEIVGRDAYMQDWAHSYGNGGFTSFEYTDEYIRLFGNMALVRSKTVWTKFADNKVKNGSSVYTDTYIKENGRWWCVQAQITSIKPKPLTSDAATTMLGVSHATGIFEVKITPQPPGETPTPGRMTIDKQYRGDIEAASKGQMLSAETGVKGSGGYVAIELVTGKLNGRSGSFMLQHSGTMTRGAGQLTLAVIPDSGTDQLAGLNGTMSITISEGKHLYDFEYRLEGSK